MSAYPEKWAELGRRLKARYPEDWDARLQSYKSGQNPDLQRWHGIGGERFIPPAPDHLRVTSIPACRDAEHVRLVSKAMLQERLHANGSKTRGNN